MRTAGEIKQKLKQAKFRHVKRLILERFGKESADREEIELLKRQVYAIFDSPPHIVAREFPDVAALMWVLDGDSSDFVADSTLVGTLDGVMLWADSEGEATHARELLDALASKSPKKPWWKVFS